MSPRAPLSGALLLGVVLVLGVFARHRLAPSPITPPSPEPSQPLPGALRAPTPSLSALPVVQPGAVRQLSPTLLLDENDRLWSYMKSYGGIDLCFEHESGDAWSHVHRTVADAVAVAPLNYPDGLCSLDARGTVQCCQRPPRPRPSPNDEVCWRGISYSSDVRENAAKLVPQPGQPAPLDPLCADGSFAPLLHDIQEITGAATSHCLSDYAFDGFDEVLLCGMTPTCALKKDGTIVCWTSLDKPPYPVPTPPAWGKVTHLQISDLGQLIISTQDGRVASSSLLLREIEENNLRTSPHPPLIRQRKEPIRFQSLFTLPDVVHLTAGAEVCAAQASGDVWCTRPPPYYRRGRHDSKPIEAIPARQMKRLIGVRSISSNNNHSCAVDQVGQVWCWGLRLGMPAVVREDDEEENRLTWDYFAQPVRVRTRRPARQVAVLPHSTCIALDDDSLQCLGTNFNHF